jgi:hypothetical protein
MMCTLTRDVSRLDDIIVAMDGNTEHEPAYERLEGGVNYPGLEGHLIHWLFIVTGLVNGWHEFGKIHVHVILIKIDILGTSPVGPPPVDCNRVWIIRIEVSVIERIRDILVGFHFHLVAIHLCILHIQRLGIAIPSPLSVLLREPLGKTSLDVVSGFFPSFFDAYSTTARMEKSPEPSLVPPPPSIELCK